MDDIRDLPFMDKVSNLPGQVENFSGHQSYFRRDKKRKPLIFIGQDEAICKQYLTNTMTWYAPDGSFRVVPKDEGMGFMVSLLCSREFGIGFKTFGQKIY